MTSWIPISDDSDFSLQNLPYGVFSTESSSPRIGTAIGDHVLDLAALAQKGIFSSIDFDSSVFGQHNLNTYASLDKRIHKQVRAFLQEFLAEDTKNGAVLRDDEDWRQRVLIPLHALTMHLPMVIGDYTDFLVGLYHAQNCTEIVRPGASMGDNFFSQPIGYHGRASSIVVSETPFRRPKGQMLVDGKPVKGKCRKLDFEVEFAAFIGRGNEMGKKIRIDEATDHIFGVVLMNDWSARDIQMWESTPLGPFNGKNFCTSISPWIVTLEALEPFRTPTLNTGTPLSYLKEKTNASAYDIPVKVSLEENGTEFPLLSTNTKYAYFSFEQMLAHHTYGGCPMRTGDLIGTGTVSGPTQEELACLLEATRNGADHVETSEVAGKRLRRTFLEDGDSVAFYAQTENRTCLGRVGFGRCAGRCFRLCR